MIIQIVELTVAENEIAIVRDATADKVRGSRTEPGIVGFDCYCNSELPGFFVMQEIYRDRQAMADHKQTEHYLRWRDIVERTGAKSRTKRVLSAWDPEESIIQR